MTDAATTMPAEPDGATDTAARLPVLDILRGIAILLILPMNISDMGGSLYAFFAGEPRRLGWGGTDQAVWWVREVFANGTARCLLEMLFGVGMVILTGRMTRRAYAWRHAVLFLFGMVHVLLLLWPGDILHSYALAALVAMWFRNLRPRWLLTIGLSLAALQLAGVTTYVAMTGGRQAAIERIEAKPAPTAAERKELADHRKARAAAAMRRADLLARADAEDKARTGAAWSWAAALWGVFFYFQSLGLEIAVVLEAATTMLIGAALYKLGVIQGGRGRGFYLRLTLAAYAVGLTLRAWAAHEVMKFTPGPSLAEGFGEIARLATTLGHVALVNLLVLGAAGFRALWPFAAAGRTALTLYILQTLICLWVLYPPWGFRLYNQQGWTALMATAFAIDAALLVLAVWWVRRFPIAPVEWAWRSAVAGKALPFRS